MTALLQRSPILACFIQHPVTVQHTRHIINNDMYIISPWHVQRTSFKKQNRALVQKTKAQHRHEAQERTGNVARWIYTSAKQARGMLG